MRRIALQTLAFDRGKLVASVAGVAFATSLVLAQFGLYEGFLDAAAAVIRHCGGDLWIMGRGTEVLDNSEPLSPVSRAAVLSHPAVRAVRGLALGFAPVRKASGARDFVMVVGCEARQEPLVPWDLIEGLPQDLTAHGRVSVDRLDLAKLQLPDRPIGSTLDVADHVVQIAAVTQGIRSFTLSPYLFTDIRNARRLLFLAEGQASYWIADLSDPGRAAEVARWVDRHPDLQAIPTERWAAMTEEFWVGGSGAGTALLFSALLGLVVGTVVVGQTLYTVTKEHLRELAMLKAVGATRAELASFVLWQVALLVVLGGGLGLLFAVAIRHFGQPVGVAILLSNRVLSLGAAAIVTMCGVASLASLRTVLSLEAGEVFK